MNERKIAILLAAIGILMIRLGIYLQIQEDNKERCYNLPINQYVEDKACEKYTWEDYMEEHYEKN